MSLCSTRKYFPSIHSAWLVSLNFPPGTPGPGFIVPSAVQVPDMKSSFFNSGAGGGGACASSDAAVNSAQPATNAASDKRLILILLCRVIFPGAPIVGRDRK